MNARARHLDAICAALERRLDSAPAATARRLLRPQLGWVAQQLDDGAAADLAHRLGVVELLESCRNEQQQTRALLRTLRRAAPRTPCTALQPVRARAGVTLMLNAGSPR
jgi:hypothetical protein